MILGWLASLASSPLVTKILVPWLAQAVANFFEKRATALEVKAAVTIAKASKTADDLRAASKKLTDASNRAS